MVIDLGNGEIGRYAKRLEMLNHRCGEGLNLACIGNDNDSGGCDCKASRTRLSLALVVRLSFVRIHVLIRIAFVYLGDSS